MRFPLLTLWRVQSMFLDSLVGDAAWRGRYARDRNGKPVPWDLLENDIRSNHPYKVFPRFSQPCRPSQAAVWCSV